MGSQHNTHIYNDSGETVKVILSDSNHEKIDKILEHEKLICIPTIHGINTIFVYKMVEGGQFSDAPEATLTDKSDISFIVTKVGKYLEVSRSKYGGFVS